MKRWCDALLVIVCLGAFICASCQNDKHAITVVSKNDWIPLRPEQPAIGSISANPITYSFNLNNGELSELSLQKEGTGIAVSILYPDGKVLPYATCSLDGPLHFTALAAIPGEYGVRLTSCVAPSAASYQLSLSAARQPTPDDHARAAAERLTSQAELLIAEYRKESRRSAISKYEEALTQWKVLQDLFAESSVLTRIASLYRDVGEAAKAAESVEGALSAARSARDIASEGEALLMLATIQLSKGDTSKAVESGNHALKIARSISNARMEALALYTLGRIWYETGKYTESTNALSQAEKIAEGRGDRLGAARALLYLAAIDFDLLRFDTARDKGLQVLRVFESFGDKPGQTMALTYVGHFQSRLDQKQEAMMLYEQARSLAADSGDFFIEASLLNGIAAVNFDLGNTKAALQFLNLALEKNRALGDRIGIAYALRAIGDCYVAEGDSTSALDSYNQALRTFTLLSNRRMEAYVSEDIGIVLESMGDIDGAMERLNFSLKIGQSTGDRRMEAWARTGIGHVYETANRLDNALESYKQALRAYDASGDRWGKVSVLYHIAKAFRRTGKLEEALTYSENALAAIEKFRTSVANSGLRSSYFASVRQQYDLYIDVLMRLHRRTGLDTFAVRAFETSERSRARTLLESISETRMAILRGGDPKQIQRAAILRTLLDSKVERYTELLSAKADKKVLSQVSGEIRTLTAESDELEAELRVHSPRYASLTLADPFNLPELQRALLDEDSLLLEYSLGEENSYLWAITRDAFFTHVLPARSEIEKKVIQVRELLTARSRLSSENIAQYQSRVRVSEAQYEQTVADLGRILLGPLNNLFRKHRLIIVAEGALQYLPFGALPVGSSQVQSRPLIVGHEIVSLPSASTLAIIRREASRRGNPDRTLAVFADPVFQKRDPRVNQSSTPTANVPVAAVPTEGMTNGLAQMVRSMDGLDIGTDLPRLPFTRTEAESILAMVPQNRRMAALGFSATRTAVMSEDLKRYRIVHFATHALLNDEHPDLSSLVLSLVDGNGKAQNGFLRLRDIYNLQLAAELVVLSACDTALGKEVKGEGLMSMVRGFMYSGTPRVMASLWKIDDEATAELMKEFYKHLLQEGMTPAAALRQAQITQMQKKSRQSPYYWAGFQLQGEWN